MCSCQQSSSPVYPRSQAVLYHIHRHRFLAHPKFCTYLVPRTLDVPASLTTIFTTRGAGFF